MAISETVFSFPKQTDFYRGKTSARCIWLRRTFGVSSQRPHFGSFDSKFTDTVLDEIDTFISQDPEPDDVLDFLLNDKGNEGILVGEVHGESDAKKFIVKNINKIKKSDVDTIYVEHFRYSEYQHFLDAYFDSDIDAKMPHQLESFANASDSKFNIKSDYPYTLLGLLHTCKKNGVRVVAGDDALGKNTGQKGKLTGEERVANMNLATKKIIEGDDKRMGKYLMLLGAAHSQTHQGKTKGVAGLSQMLEVPSIKVTKDNGITHHKENKNLRAGGKGSQ
ncbi:MAG: hypothetical protein JJT94_17505 [Bernardetiaceae bacterium]|nr:hypothetical protein [Bernardetiaceae bacterium]